MSQQGAANDRDHDNDRVGADAASLFEQTLEIDTPERVRIRYELAGIGSRFAAGTIDVLILGFVLVALFIVLLLVASVTLEQFEQGWRAMAIAAYGVALAVVWFYYLGFELLWDGQTPGKRIMRLRAVSDEGGPAPASAIVVRNVLRVIDMVPLVLVHVLGGVVMFINGHSKRIGDLAAGTVVVQEREVELSLDRLSRGVLDQLGGDELGGEDRARLKRFVARRRELREARRVEVAGQLIDELRERFELPDADAESIIVMLAGGRKPSELRDLGGPRLAPEPQQEAEPAAGDGAGAIEATTENGEGRENTARQDDDSSGGDSKSGGDRQSEDESKSKSNDGVEA